MEIYCINCNAWIPPQYERLIEWHHHYTNDVPPRLATMTQVRIGYCGCCGKLSAKSCTLVFDAQGNGVEMQP